jgi:hypothetical protein
VTLNIASDAYGVTAAAWARSQHWEPAPPARTPPNWHSLTTAALLGDTQAQRVIERHEVTERVHRRLVAATGRVADIRTDRNWEPAPCHDRLRDGFIGPLPRRAYREVERVQGVEWSTGEWQAIERPAALRPEWVADPRKLHAQLRTCSAGWGVMRSPDGVYRAQPMRCGSPLCPTCLAHKARRVQERWAPMLAELAARGCRFVHVTLTQPARAAAPSGAWPMVLNANERTHYVHAQAATEVGLAVEGEPLGDALARLRASWTALRDSRATREWWGESVVGYLYGIEWTGRRHAAQDAGATWDARWHAHLHALVVLHPEVRDGRPGWQGDRGRLNPYRGGWAGRLVREWCARTPGADPAAQAVVRVTGDEGRTAADALREVLKYPFKPGELTDAQVVEVLATTKGGRFHLPGGAFHGASGAARCAASLVAAGLGADLGPSELRARVDAWADQAGRGYNAQARATVKGRRSEAARAERARVGVWRRLLVWWPAYHAARAAVEEGPAAQTLYRRPVEALDSRPGCAWADEKVGRAVVLDGWVRVTWADLRACERLGVSHLEVRLASAQTREGAMPGGWSDGVTALPMPHTDMVLSTAFLRGELRRWRPEVAARDADDLRTWVDGTPAPGPVQ